MDIIYKPPDLKPQVKTLDLEQLKSESLDFSSSSMLGKEKGHQE